MFTYALSLSLALLASPAYAAVLNINVGANNLTFTPSWIHAEQDDIVNFIFHVDGHSVTQSSLDTPCIAASSGFDSGFMTAASNYQVKISNTDPIWVYCGQTTGPPPAPTHCQQGMVFAINPPAYPPNTLALFHAHARDSTAQNQPAGSASVSRPVATATSAPISGNLGGDTGDDESSPSSVSMSPSSVSTAAASWYTSLPGYNSSASNGIPTIHPVVVGGMNPNGTNKLQFDPPFLSDIPVGDIILFDFQVANHSATVSSFDEPCAHNGTDFDSGFQPVTNTTDFLRLVAFTVTEETPTWMYCRQPGAGPKTHCQQGMVFAVNPTTDKPFSQFLTNALQSTIQNVSGSSSPAIASASASGVSSLSSSASTGGVGAISDLSAVSGSDPSTDSSDLQRLVNYAPIMLGLLGGLLLLVLGLLGLLVMLVRKSSQQAQSAGPKYKPIHLSHEKVDHESEGLEYQTPSGRYTDGH